MFSEHFWQGVQVLSQTVKEARPLVGNADVRELHSRLEELPWDVQEQLQHDLKILIAALIQIERTIQVHRPTMGDGLIFAYLADTSSGQKPA